MSRIKKIAIATATMLSMAGGSLAIASSVPASAETIASSAPASAQTITSNAAASAPRTHTVDFLMTQHGAYVAEICVHSDIERICSGKKGFSGSQHATLKFTNRFSLWCSVSVVAGHGNRTKAGWGHGCVSGSTSLHPSIELYLDVP
jgi:hypothetical protein